MHLDDYSARKTSDLYLEDLPYILHSSWAISKLKYEMTLNRYSHLKTFNSFGFCERLILNLKNGRSVLIKNFPRNKEILGILDYKDFPKQDLPLFLKCRLHELIECQIKRPVVIAFYPNSFEIPANQATRNTETQTATYGNNLNFIKGYVEHSEKLLSVTPATSAVDGLNAAKNSITNPSINSAVQVVTSLIPKWIKKGGTIVKNLGKSARTPVGRAGQKNSYPNPNAPKPRNTPEIINGRSYSGHAIDRMQERGYTPSVIENVLKNGTPSTGNRANTKVFTDTVNNVRVIINSNTGNVVTVISGVK